MSCGLANVILENMIFFPKLALMDGKLNIAS